MPKLDNKATEPIMDGIDHFNVISPLVAAEVTALFLAAAFMWSGSSERQADATKSIAAAKVCFFGSILIFIITNTLRAIRHVPELKRLAENEILTTINRRRASKIRLENVLSAPTPQLKAHDHNLELAKATYAQLEELTRQPPGLARYAELSDNMGYSAPKYGNGPFPGGHTDEALGLRSRATTPPAAVTPTTSLFFAKLPIEIRILIYRLLLTTLEAIPNPAELVEYTTLGLISNDKHPTLPFHSSLLRVCRKMHTEALPILYGENTFCFHSKAGLHTFRSEGLAQKYRDHRLISMFNLCPDPNGRFALVKILSLNLTSENHFNTSAVPNIRRLQDRGLILIEWRRFLHQSKYDSVDSDGYIEFPLLESLTLDFTDWRLQTHEGLIVRPFINRFRGTEGLRRLAVKGVSHERSLTQLSEGLLREGGIFEKMQ